MSAAVVESPTSGGRVLAGTRIALRRATDEELSYMWDQLWKTCADMLLDRREPEEYRIRASTYVVC
jgi:hypothetical protein